MDYPRWNSLLWIRINLWLWHEEHHNLRVSNGWFPKVSWCWCKIYTWVKSLLQTSIIPMYHQWAYLFFSQGMNKKWHYHLIILYCFGNSVMPPLQIHRLCYACTGCYFLLWVSLNKLIDALLHFYVPPMLIWIIIILFRWSHRILMQYDFSIKQYSVQCYFRPLPIIFWQFASLLLLLTFFLLHLCESLEVAICSRIRL